MYTGSVKVPFYSIPPVFSDISHTLIDTEKDSWLFLHTGDEHVRSQRPLIYFDGEVQPPWFLC